MPRVCDRCQFHAADPAPAACPDCGGPLQFTLLGPPNEAMAPIAGVPTGVTGKFANNADRQDIYYDAKPGLLSGFVPAKFAGPLLFLLGLAVLALIITIVTTPRAAP